MSLLGILEKRSTLANPDRFLAGFFGGQATESGTSVSEQNALTYTTVLACVGVIAEAMATLPLNLYLRRDDGGQDLISNLPLARLLSAEPNDEMSTAAFKSVEMGWVLTWGNGYAEIERNNAGLPMALHPLAPNRIVPRRRTGDWRVEYYVTRTALQSPYLLEQQVVTNLPCIDRDDMLHFSGLGFDGIVGYSPVAMAREAIGLGLSAQAYGARFFGNSGVPSGTLQSDKVIKNPEKLREAWNRANGGGKQRGTAVLEDGVKFNAIGIPPEDSQFLETRKFQRSEIAGIYRVPPYMIGDLERSTNNNIEHQGMDFVKYCLMGWLVRWEQECTRKLLTPDQKNAGYFYAFDADELLRGDTLARYQAYAVGRQWGWLSADDVRQREHMNALEGEQGKIYLVPMNMVPADRMANPALPADPGAGGEDPASDPSNPPPPAPTLDDGRSGKLRASFRAVLTDAAARVIRKETQAVRRAAKKPESFAATVSEFYGNHRDFIAGAMLPTAATLAEVFDRPFADVRRRVEGVAQVEVGRAMEALADKDLDVEALMTRWDRERPTEIADLILKEIGL